MLRIAVLFACIQLDFGQPDIDPPLLARLPNIMKEFCPGVNVCNKNMSTISKEKTFGPWTESCCVECSCESDCMLNDDCCFPHALPTDHNAEEKLKDVTRSHSCLYPITPQPNEDSRIYYKSLSMVSSISINEMDSSDMTSKMSCGNTIVAPWGSLFPVYSPMYNRIYKNIECANADGITDGVVWDAVISCVGTDATNAVIALESNMIPENCVVNFMYPGDVERILLFECHGSLIETCPEAVEFEVPKGTSLSNNDIKALCKSGLVSPYKQLRVYANVFCHICNGEFYRQDILCQTRSAFPGRGDSPLGFTALIDESYIAETRKTNSPDGKDDLSVPVACSPVDASNCLYVFCPSGQLRNKRGKCTYPNKVWYDQTYAVKISLSLDKSYSMSELFNVKLGGVSASQPPLKSPWPKEWSIDSILYKETNMTHYSDNIIIVINAKLALVKPDRFIKNVRKMVMRSWSLDLYNSTITLISNGFGTYTPTHVFDESKDHAVFRNITKIFERPLYRLVYWSPVFSGFHSIITKMYTCEQVELDQSDFILSDDKNMLYSYTSERFLYSGEFVLMLDNAFEESRARICTVDSGLYSAKESNYGTRLKASEAFLGMLLMSVLLYGKHQSL